MASHSPDIGRLFEEAHLVSEVDAWIDYFEKERQQDAPIPLQRLLDGIERAKDIKNARPNIQAVWARDDLLQPFDPDLLTAKLQAVETIIGKRWIEVDTTSYDVRLHHTADQIVAEVERVLRDLFGVNAIKDILELTIDCNPDADLKD